VSLLLDRSNRQALGKIAKVSFEAKGRGKKDRLVIEGDHIGRVSSFVADGYYEMTIGRTDGLLTGLRDEG
jgi:hypothetical protein